MAKSKRIGILGGTFNPIHMGHLVLAEQARGLLRLEKVIFIPTNLPPHKRVSSLAPAQERYHMVAKALKSNPRFEVSDLELIRGGVSYSVETLRKLKSIFRHTALYFIVGSDFLKEFSGWRDIDKLSKICKFVIAARPGYPLGRLPGNMQAIKVSALDISSTGIRKRIRTKKPIRYLVPEEVRKYILKKGLYRVRIKNT
ncbi:MAG: nicotinate-nucleotide adenylyltransferase [Candidatus Omnitrophica bacterium]|nr:nicotinate-nucleotide adenylyltransferase [Candidatus Omnitrophota bacterium]